MRILMLSSKTAHRCRIIRGIVGRLCYVSTPPPSIPDTFFKEHKNEFIKRIEQFSSHQRTFNKETTLAGILIPFCIVDGKPSILFTKRSHKITRNKGDVSFPGGKMDIKVDKNIVDTALRETTEETGLSKSDVDVWFVMKPLIQTNDAAINIVPVFGFIQNFDISRIIIDKDEVTSVFTVTLEELCDPDNHAYTKFNNGVVMPLFYKKPFKIWGFTAIILDFCLSNLLPHLYSLRYKPPKRQKKCS